MVFNVLAWNCDDHVKNISYLMDKSGAWSLAPAYDVCYAYNRLSHRRHSVMRRPAALAMSE